MYQNVQDWKFKNVVPFIQVHMPILMYSGIMQIHGNLNIPDILYTWYGKIYECMYIGVIKQLILTLCNQTGKVIL